MSNAVIEIVKEMDQEKTESSDPSLVTLSSGIVLRTKSVPYKLIVKLQKRYKLPSVPTFYDEDKGRTIPNYADPKYEEDCNLVLEEKGIAMLELLTGLGTEVVSVPKGKYRPEDKEWADEIAFYLDEGETIPESGKARYVQWINYYALIEAKDVAEVTGKIQKRMGVSEAGVAEAMNRFPGDERRPADTGSRTEE